MNKLKLTPMLTAGMVAATLTACGGAPKKVESLEEARAAYSRASQDEIVARHAPEELDQAHEALKLAESRWKKEDDLWRIDHYAYLTSQRVRIAELIAESNESNRALEKMELERRDVTLNIREAQLAKAAEEAQAREAKLQQAAAEAEELKRQMAELEAKNTERGIVLTLGDVLFDINESSLKAGAMRNIDNVAAFMDKYPERQAVIEGHTDNIGDPDYNMGLSRDRAFAVRSALVARGISPARITTQGFGMTLPVASNNTAVGRQENRRVEIIFPDVATQVSSAE